MVALKERVKQQKGKAAGAELQASTEDAQAMAALEELVRCWSKCSSSCSIKLLFAQHKDILSKGQEKISVAERTEEMVQVELDKLGALLVLLPRDLSSPLGQTVAACAGRRA